MQTKDDVFHLTLLVLSNQTVWLGYTRVPANDLWCRDSIRASVRLLFPSDEMSLEWADEVYLEQIVGDAHDMVEPDSKGWALAPEMTVNLAHVLFARTIPDGEVECRLVSGGKYQLKIGGENDQQAV